jgi:hypothetical protein
LGHYTLYRPVLGKANEPIRAGFRLTGIFVMDKQAGWGAEYPDDIRNGEWEYARFTPEAQRHPNADTTPCFQCHKFVSGQDFVFTRSPLHTAPR